MTGLAADRLFADDYGASAEYGKEMHAKYEKIEWIPEAEVKDSFDRVFVKPDGFSELWRERSYEIFADGSWESGQFDRVVFTGEVADRKAVILDFKTNAMRQGEDVSAYEDRLLETYAPQMAAYRRAVHMLTGLPLADVSAKLLLTRTRSIVDVY